MGKVSGPFIEYACTGCGITVQERVSLTRRITSYRIDEANSNPKTRVCAGCAYTEKVGRV